MVTLVNARFVPRYCLGDTSGATELLAEQKDDASLLTTARIARSDGDLDAAAAALDGCSKESAAGVGVERGWIAWMRAQHAEAVALLAKTASEHPRSAESEYVRGLALHGLEKTADAREVWTKLVKRHGENPWSYRADWALAGTTGGGAQRSFSTSGPKSALGRHGYMGRRNPDLEALKAGD